MKPTTLCFLVKGTPIREILLGMKKTGFGKGKCNGFGGKIEAGETIGEAAIRELGEEAGVVVSTHDLVYMGRLLFIFPAEPSYDHDVHIFLAHTWEGQPQETDEMRPSWYNIDDIPYENMWQDDVFWLPDVLQGRQVHAKVTFADDNEAVKEFAPLSETLRPVR